MAHEGIYVTNWASVLGWRGLQGCSPKISFCPFSPFVSPRECKTGCSNKARFGKHRQDVIIWSMSGSCLSLCLSVCYCAFFFNDNYNFPPVDPRMAFGPHWNKPMRAGYVSERHEKDLKNLCAEGFNDCRSLFHAEAGETGNTKRSDRSSLWGLLVCWLCARLHFSLRREQETDSTAGPCMPQSWKSH